MINKINRQSALTGDVLVGPLLTLAIEVVKCIVISITGLIWSPRHIEDKVTTRTAFITGCDTGIGRAVALRLAAEGWTVFAGVYTEDGRRQLGEASSAITPIPLDVTKPESVAAAAQEVAAAVGSTGLQLLVNNAGIGALAPAECVPLEDYKRIFDINVFGVLSTTQACLPLLRAGQRKGRIITISSVAGHLSLPFWGGYAGSKHAVEGLCDCMRFELAPQGIDVVLIKPGPIRTPIWDRMGSQHEALARVLTTPDMQQVYGEDFVAMLSEADRAGKAGVDVSVVVDIIYEAATCRRPKGRYHVGPSSATVHWLKRLAPDEAWFAFMRQTLARQHRQDTAAAAAGAVQAKAA